MGASSGRDAPSLDSHDPVGKEMRHESDQGIDIHDTTGCQHGRDASRCPHDLGDLNGVESGYG